ncbi:MAG: citrate (Si)-synthase, partial [Ardenticatenales bacterium]|nr:citrate (Si)-synthase [Ardenticatenales bacterium]
MSKDTLTITDNRTGQSYELPITHDTIQAKDLRQIKVNDDDFGMMSYDPAFTNTASCTSRITYIDGDKGILEYRGYPIEALAEKSTHLEVAYLLIYGKLPTQEELDKWSYKIMHHTYIHENMVQLMKAFRYDAHPMAMLISSLAALRTFHPESKNFQDPAILQKQIFRILGKLPTIAAFAYRHRIGRPFNYPDASRGYTGNFLYMLDHMNESDYE